MTYTVEPLNNGHGGDEHFVHCLEVVPSSEVEMYGQLMAGASSLSIVGRLSSYRSVHYRRFYCIPLLVSQGSCLAILQTQIFIFLSLIISEGKLV